MINVILVYNAKGLSQINYSSKEKSNSNYKSEGFDISLEERLLIIFNMFNCKDILIEDFLNKVYRFTH